MTDLLNKSTYAQYKKWKDVFPDCKVNIEALPYRSSWNDMFKTIKNEKDNLISKINTNLSSCLEELENEILYPLPDMLFNAFAMTDFDKLKVVFIGQDPYFNHETENDISVPQAMGLSFSVPVGFQIPSSLGNIYQNLVKFEHIKQKPTHGNLSFWAYQGCLMLNTSLTVLEGDENKNCHQYIWKKFTERTIRYISDKCDKLVFVIWGAHAYGKLEFIDLDKHDVIITTHPSGLSAGKTMKPAGNSKEYPSFNSCDHFGKINTILKKWGKEPIIWDL